MPPQTCWCCLARASPNPSSLLPRQPVAHLVARFTTSALSQKAVPNANPKRGVQPFADKRGDKKTFIKKKAEHIRVDRSRKPAIGERRALRKRIVLSNTNALEVPGLQDFTAEKVGDESCRGLVMGLPEGLVDQLRVVEAFKVAQGWGMFRRPGMLVREETVEVGRLMGEIGGEGEGRGKSVRRVVVGERGSGKTVMLLQAMAMGFLKNWVVINIPEAQDLTIAHTAYSPLRGTSPTLYTQKDYTASLLLAISRSNPILQSLQLTQKPSTSNFPITLLPNISLAGLAQLGAEDPYIAWDVFTLLFKELTQPGRPPLLITLDSLSRTMLPTSYLSPTYAPIHAHSLALINWYLNLLSGTTPLPNGGIILAATSASNAPKVPTLELALSQLQNDQSVKKDPFKKYDEQVLGVFEKGGVEVMRIGGVEKMEARSLLEFWAQSGLFRGAVSSSIVGEKWAVSGGGVVGELERGVVRVSGLTYHPSLTSP